jgi:hypothetical protein
MGLFFTFYYFRKLSIYYESKKILIDFLCFFNNKLTDNPH